MIPKVSVIIPNYNHSKYLPLRIRSVLDQTYQHFELLVLDDCSPDNSQQIISEYQQQNPRIKTSFNEKNSGNTFIQWKNGIERTSGEYIWIAESDDYADITFLERLVPVLDENPNIGLVYCQSWKIDEEDNILGSYTEWTDDLDSLRWKGSFVNNGKTELQQYFCLKNTIPNASAVLFRRSTFLKTGSIETSMKLCGDKMFWARLMLAGDVAFIPDHLNFFRHHTNNVRTNSSSNNNLIENIKTFSFFQNSVSIPYGKKIMVLKHFYAWWMYNLVHNNETILSDIHRKVLKTMLIIDKLAHLKIIYYLSKHYLLKGSKDRSLQNG